MKVRMRCLVCRVEAVIDIPVQKYGELEIVPVPDCYCKRCKILVVQTIDGVAEKENEENQNPHI